MYFLPSAPSLLSPPGLVAASAPLPFSDSMKEIPMISFSSRDPSTVFSAAPPSYDAVALDPKGPRSQTNLFVRKLASAVTEDDMRKLFEQYGTIMSFALMRDIHTGESLGTAFVRYNTHEEARAAMAALDGRELYGRPISIQWAKREHDSTPCGEARRKIRKLFVRNIPLDVTSRDLRQIFSKFGSISNITLHSDTAPSAARDSCYSSRPGNQPRNIAFILFQEDDVAEQAVSVLHNTCPFESCEGIPLMVKLAEDNRDRIDRKQRFCDNSVANANAKVLAASMMQSSHLSTATSVSPLTVPLSTPASATLSPATLSMDVSHNSPLFTQDSRASSLPPNGQPTLPFTVSTPTATATPLLQTTVGANGNTAYVYVSPASNTGVPQQVLAATSTPGQYVIASSGLHSFSAANRMVSQPSQPPQTFYTATAPPSVPRYYQAVALPQVFVDAQGQPMQPQSNVFVPGYYPFSPNQSSPQQPPHQGSLVEIQGSPITQSLQTGPPAPQTASDVFQNQSPPQHQMPHGKPIFSVSPHLSGVGGVSEPVPTALFSASDSPLNAAIDPTSNMPAQQQVPIPLIPLSADADAHQQSFRGPTNDNTYSNALMREMSVHFMGPRVEHNDEVKWGTVCANTPTVADAKRNS